MTAPDAPLDRLLEHRAWVRGLVRRLVLDPAGADDVEQQVWLTAVRHGGASIEEPRAWLGAVARNWARRAWRGTSRRARREAAVARPEATENDGDPVERAEAHRAVVDAVLALPEPLRTAVLLHHFDGLSVADVAARVGAPHETVRSRLRLARTRLRDALRPSHGGSAWSPALLVLAGLPRDFTAPVAAGAASTTAGAIAMTAAQKVAFALVVPIAVGAAWITARTSAAPATDPARDDALAAIEARLDRIEKTVASLPPVRAGNDRALAHRVEALEAQLAEQSHAPAASAKGTAAQPAGDAAAATGSSAAKSARAPAQTSADAKAARDEILAGLKAKPGSAEHLAALKRLAEWLIENAGPPPATLEIQWAQGLFDMEARGDRVTPAEAAELVLILDRTSPGNAARPGIAAGIAGGWAKDPQLANFLARFATNSEPLVHQQLLMLLDHHPSDAFSDYVLRLVREERDSAVLGSALKSDRVQAATTAETAVQFAQAVETRIGDGSLSAKGRREAACAVAVCGLRAPDACAEMLGRIGSRDADPRVQDACRVAAVALTDRSATAKSLENLFR
jgi:RNA polymerase sigma-70 factor (ECF subfamily)